ncbi:MAG: 2'-5' RNA ligase [Bacteroidetes bacterium GWE2_41_25]|nr:MAG: 2'-5' RNA ligase [Bacteroidetes bacterium GWE2_41_25]HCU20818.1 RNA 2',3'-cyclic phosphodiesterase [Bacteroidales bacterium]
MKRIFIAVKVEPDKSLLAMLSTFKQALRNDVIKWTDNANIHITLLFLGDTPEKRVKEIGSVLQQQCRGSGEFELVIRGSGVFKSPKDPRVIWAGIGPSEKMNKLHKILSQKLRETGTELEERSFNPHLTLGRVKKINDPAILKVLLDEFREKEIQRVRISEIILYESILRPEGPIYKPLGKYSLM